MFVRLLGLLLLLVFPIGIAVSGCTYLLGGGAVLVAIRGEGGSSSDVPTTVAGPALSRRGVTEAEVTFTVSGRPEGTTLVLVQSDAGAPGGAATSTLAFQPVTLLGTLLADGSIDSSTVVTIDARTFVRVPTASAPTLVSVVWDLAPFFGASLVSAFAFRRLRRGSGTGATSTGKLRSNWQRASEARISLSW